MSIAAYDLTAIVSALMISGCCGWWIVAPLRRSLPCAPAVAPLAGLVVLPLATLALHVAGGLSLQRAAVGSVLLLAAASLIAFVADRRIELTRAAILRVSIFGAAAMLAAAGWSTWFVTSSDRYFDGPALSYVHGTDHLGYTHVADWMQAHQGNIGPMIVGDWYGSWPQLIYTSDPRFGSFTLVALTSMATGRPSSFAYDLTCAIVLTAAALGLAGLFARRKLTFVLLAFAVLSGYWFDWSRGGYLGKAFGFPATLLGAALFVTWAGEIRRRTHASPLLPFAGIAAVTAGAALAFNGLVTGVFILVIGGLFVALDPLMTRTMARRRRPLAITTALVALVVLIAIAVLSAGILARPLFFGGTPDLPWTWRELLPRVAELEGLIPGLTIFSSSTVWMLTVAGLILWTGLAAAACAMRDPRAAAFLVAPVMLLAGLYFKDLRWHAMNFISLFGVPAMCGAIALVETLSAERRARWLRVTVTVAIVLTIAVHLPRFWATASLHGGATTPAGFRFSEAETDALASAILRGGGSAIVDVGDNPQLNVFLLVEMGRRGIALQWTEAGWKRALGYRPWPVPIPAVPAPLRIRVRNPGAAYAEPPVMVTSQYELIKNVE